MCATTAPSHKIPVWLPVPVSGEQISDPIRPIKTGLINTQLARLAQEVFTL